MQEKDPGPIVDSWCLFLGDMPYDLAQQALVKVMCAARNFPLPAEIRDAAVSLLGGGLPTWEEAWQELLKAISDYGMYRVPQWTHEAIGEVVKATWGSWQRCCESMPAGGGSAERAQFRDMYLGLTRHDREAATLPGKLPLPPDKGRLPEGS
jgi:hypothetical protein